MKAPIHPQPGFYEAVVKDLKFDPEKVATNRLKIISLFDIDRALEFLYGNDEDTG